MRSGGITHLGYLGGLHKRVISSGDILGIGRDFTVIHL